MTISNEYIAVKLNKPISNFLCRDFAISLDKIGRINVINEFANISINIPFMLIFAIFQICLRLLEL